jgi:hypothetical protein
MHYVHPRWLNPPSRAHALGRNLADGEAIDISEGSGAATKAAISLSDVCVSSKSEIGGVRFPLWSLP